ncbi:MAG: DoxX family membrane protein [Bacteroidales bacterium]|nr:DoxX family membrane protein [Bacteroidales bacterium]
MNRDRTFALLLGGIFIFSGVMKAFNIEAFDFEIFHYTRAYLSPALTPLSMTAAFVFASLEILFGFMTLRDRFVWTGSLGCLALLTFFVWLTGTNYFFPSTTYGSIETCGCFGELIHLNPLQSFVKSVLLWALSLYVFLRLPAPRKSSFRPSLFLDRYILWALLCGPTLALFSLLVLHSPIRARYYILLYTTLLAFYCWRLWKAGKK